MRHHQLLNGLSLRWDKSYDELINVCNISLGINVYFCASATFGISRFLIVQSWEFHGRLEVSWPIKYMLGSNSLFRGHEMYQFK